MEFTGTGDGNAAPHQYPSYKPTTEFIGEFIPTVEDPDFMLRDRPLGDSYCNMPSALSDPAHDLVTMVYISNVPLSLEDYALEQILWVCGPVRRYHRVRDWYGNNRKSAFCVFENSVGLIRALRVLGGEGYQDIPELKGGFKLIPEIPGTNLVVTADPIARFSIKNIRDKYAVEQDKQAISKIRILLEGITIDRNENFNASLNQPVTSPEIKPVAPRRPISPFPEDEIDEQEVMKRKEKREKERILAFKDRERRFEGHEQGRLRKVFDDIAYDEMKLEKSAKDKVYLAEYLAKFDDDLEKELNELEFFRDPARWWSKRKRESIREEDMDERDRREEYEEMEYKNRQTRDKAPKQEPREDKHTAVHIPEPEGFVVTRIMTKEERVNAIKELFQKIPADKQGLWSWQVKWKFMSEIILEKKIAPFLRKKIVEVIGEEEKDMIDFVLKRIRSHSSAQDIYDELEPVLDEETEVFVLKLWRMVIYETEAAAQGL